MSIRFTETRKWNKDWYRELGSKWRDIWQYLLDNCDHAGLYDLSLSNIEYYTGHKVTLEELLNAYGHRLIQIPNKKLFLTTFVIFQQRGKLNPANKVHASILALLASNRLKVVPKDLGRSYQGAIVIVKEIVIVIEIVNAENQENERAELISAIRNSIKSI